MTTIDKILNYLSDCEAGDLIPVTHFTEAYGVVESRKALFSLASDEKVRLVALTCIADYCDQHCADEADLIDTGEQIFGYVVRTF